VPAWLKRHQSCRALAGELRAVVTADEPRRGASFGNQALQHGHGGVGVDPAVDLDGEGFAGVLVHDVEQLEDPPVEGLVELVVQRPHMIRVLGRQPVRRDGRAAKSLAFAPLGRHAEAFLAPQALDGLAVHGPALLAQHGVGAAIAPPGMDAAELPQLGAEGLVPLGLDRLVTLGGAVLPDQLARPPLGDPEHLLECSTARRRRAGLTSFPAPAP
jgi:hypothetical protein